MAKIFLFLIISLALFAPGLSSHARTPALFVLGDSTVDVGTNIYVNGPSTANFLPYGIDFHHSKPTGRFSNGFTTYDFVARHLGFRRSPQPYLYLINHKHALGRLMFRGVNFASAGSGLLDTTGSFVVPFSEQIRQFALVQGNLTARLGAAQAGELLSKSMFFISTGSNDLAAYLARNATVPPQKFLGFVMTTYQAHITALYGLGARKFAILSVPALGCIPVSRLRNATGGCMDPVNSLADAFHSALVTVFPTIASSLPGLKYSIGNSYEMTLNAIRHPQLFNFTNFASACCGTGRLNAQTPCNVTANVCPNRNELPGRGRGS